MPDPFRVMMLVTDLQRGGTPLRTVNLAAALRAHDVLPIVGSLAPRGPLHDELAALNIPSFHCDATGPASLRALRRWVELIDAIDPVLIHASLFHANIAARFFAQLDRARPIITSTVTVEIERRWHNWLEGLTADRSTMHVANSPAVRDHLLRIGFDPQRTVVIRNGLDIDRVDSVCAVDVEAEGLSKERPLIVWAGRMDPVKNLETVIHAAGRMRKSGAQLVLIGDGPERERIRAMTAALGLEDAVRLLGWRSDVAAWLKAADCLLFPSHTEGAPNVVLEAMAAGCPVVASRIPAHEAIISNGVTGYLVAEADVEAFVSTVANLLGNRPKGRQIGDNARRQIRAHHGLPAIAEQWASLYRFAVG